MTSRRRSTPPVFPNRVDEATVPGRRSNRIVRVDDRVEVRDVAGVFVVRWCTLDGTFTAYGPLGIRDNRRAPGFRTWPLDRIRTIKRRPPARTRSAAAS